MKKTLIILYSFLAIILSMAASAAMTCSIKDATACTVGDEAVVLKLSDLSEGGSHAGTEADSAFTKAVCCGGVPSLEVAESPTADYKSNVLIALTSTADGHANMTEGDALVNLRIAAPMATGLTCNYASTSGSCADEGFNACLFTISGSDNAHISGCETGEYPFEYKQYCCSAGETGEEGSGLCEITDIYWGVYDESTGTLTELNSVCNVGLDMPISLFAETTGCEGATAEFTIYDDTDTMPPIDMGTVDMGTVDGVTLSPSYSNYVGTTWANAGDGVPGNYKFKAALTMPGPPPYTTESESSLVEVSGGCTAVDPSSWPEPDTYEALCGGPLTGCGAPDCDGATCIDADCDTVADCIDEMITTVANCEGVGQCNGIEGGTAGCFPSMDCTNLAWGACKACDGVDCTTIGGFATGDQIMERCSEDPYNSADTCKCSWADPYTELDPPSGCGNDQLNQWDSRFKACIEEEEFPVFTGFNIIAVLLVLSLYYGVVIIRKNKK